MISIALQLMGLVVGVMNQWRKQMIEVSITEIVLFAWAMLATASAMKYRHQNYVTSCLMKEFLSDESIRNRAVKSWQEFNETSSLKGEQ